MLEVLQRTSENVIVPLTIGGGIRESTAEDGAHYSALGVTTEYFCSVADKISIVIDAVYTVERYLAAGIFQRGEIPIEAVKEHLREQEIETRGGLTARFPVWSVCLCSARNRLVAVSIAG